MKKKPKAKKTGRPKFGGPITFGKKAPPTDLARPILKRG
jgi:hypothetical protein